MVTTAHIARVSALEAVDPGTPNPAQDIFRLGCLLYRSITGKEPFPESEMLAPLRPARPIREAVPDVPEMLGQIIDEMIDPVPANRPKKAGHVAKALRVFLAADEHAREPKAEENLAIPKERAPAPVHAHGEAEEEDEEETAPPSRRTSEHAEGLRGKVLSGWEEARPETRDRVYLSGGALGTLLLILILQLIFGLSFIYLAGLATGAAASYFVDLFVRWRRGKKDTAEAP